MKHLRQYIRRLIKESAEEVAKVMQLWDADEWEQAQELAYMMGPEFSRHPDLQMWSIYNAEEGDLVIEDVSYDQAMDPKYQAFAAWTSGYIHTEYPDRKNNPWGNTINGASARKYPPSDLDFEEAADTMREEGWKAEVVEVREEVFAVMVKLVDVGRPGLKEQVQPPPGEPGSPQIQDGPASPEDEEALENYELAEKIILAFLQSANQGIELIQYHPDKETVSVLGDIFTTLRDDIKKLMQAEDETGVNPHPGLKQHELLDYVLEELSGWQIFHMAGWEDWMPNPKESAKVMIQFRSDAYRDFTNHWFKDLPEEKQQEWIDWVGGDL